MDAEEFRKHGKAIVDYLADYMKNIKDKDVLPNVKPGYLQTLFPTQAPTEPDKFEAVMKDLDDHVVRGVTQWHHPNFHAYYPTANSFAALCGEMLSTGIACIGFTHQSSPSCTELEVIVLDWLVDAMQLPNHFLSTDPGNGGGVIQSTASDSSHIACLAARSRLIKDEHTDLKLTAYASEEAHCSVERAFRLCMLKPRKVKTLANKEMNVGHLKELIEQDIANGFTPCICVATSGTTSSCAFDNIRAVCEAACQFKLYVHVDAAYAGSMLLCPEYRYLFDGLELVDSFNFNAHKLLETNFDCSPMWFKNSNEIVNAFHMDALYLKGEKSIMPDYRHWQVPLGRRFRSLKLWFVLRLYGIEGLRNKLRKHVELAKYFQGLIEKDDRFEIVAPVILGLVCFRFKNDNTKTERLHSLLMQDRRIFLVTSKFQRDDIMFLRFVICTPETTQDDVLRSYNVINELANSLQ